jgi:hypothetical protein
MEKLVKSTRDNISAAILILQNPSHSRDFKSRAKRALKYYGYTEVEIHHLYVKPEKE